MTLAVVATFDYGGNSHTVYSGNNGDELPLHMHTDIGHLTLCMSGIIEAFFPDREPIVSKPGDAPLEFGINRLHGIRTKANGTLFMSIVVK